MADTNFNYSTPAFQQHAEHPGFWNYAPQVRSDGSRYEIQMEKATAQPVPMAA
jgi:hypothetical protein